MTAGSEVVEDYGHVGLTLRNHPVSFLRGDLHSQRIVTCADAMQARDGRWLQTLASCSCDKCRLGERRRVHHH